MEERRWGLVTPGGHAHKKFFVRAKYAPGIGENTERKKG